jgi:hypothetical protein
VYREEIGKMLRSLDSLLRYEINATDTNLGKVDDFFFDDCEWRVRYLVVDTGRWLPGRRVLLSPVAVGQADWAARQVHVNLTKEQIENSPGIDTHAPVSRQKEKELTAYYGWPVYWGPHGIEAPPPLVGQQAEGTATASQPSGGSTAVAQDDPSLRSMKEVTGYHIEATDGEIGHVEDFIADDEDWTIRYAVVDTRNWLPGKKVLVAPWMIRAVRWRESRVHLELTREQVQGAPEYDPSAPVNREYETQLYDYYGRPVYWH